MTKIDGAKFKVYEAKFKNDVHKSFDDTSDWIRYNFDEDENYSFAKTFDADTLYPVRLVTIMRDCIRFSFYQDIAKFIACDIELSFDLYYKNMTNIYQARDLAELTYK